MTETSDDLEKDYFSCLVPAAGEAGLTSFSDESLVVGAAPVVEWLFILSFAIVSFDMVESEAFEPAWAVGLLAGGVDCANAAPAAVRTRAEARKRLRIFIIELFKLSAGAARKSQG